MRRLSIVLVLALAAVGWPAATNAAHAATAAAGSLQADFNNDGFADLAVGVPEEISAASTRLEWSTCCTARPVG
jgi:hypothetical protein